MTSIPLVNNSTSSSELDEEIERLEKIIAADKYDMPNTESELYDLLKKCEATGQVNQTLKVLSILVHLHLLHNDMLELHNRCVEGIEIAERANIDHYLKLFNSHYEYYIQETKERDKSCGRLFIGCSLFVVLFPILLGCLVFSRLK